MFEFINRYISKDNTCYALNQMYHRLKMYLLEETSLLMTRFIVTKIILKCQSK